VLAVHIYRVQSAGAVTASEPASSRNREHFLRGPFSTAIRLCGISAAALRIDERGRLAGDAMHRLARQRMHASSGLLSVVRRTGHFHLPMLNE
jgi:hypothetical protein